MQSSAERICVLMNVRRVVKSFTDVLNKVPPVLAKLDVVVVVVMFYLQCRNSPFIIGGMLRR